MIIVFIGPPFAGKGTQAALLGKKLDLPVFSMGGIIRQAYKSGHPTAVEGFEKYSLKGLHLPISLKFPLLEEKLNNVEDGFILENFPATAEDLRTFNRYVLRNKLNVTKVFLLTLSEQQAMKRMLLRGRVDDTAEIVKKRREIQDEDRIPVINFYMEQGLLVEVNGEGDINKIHKQILDHLGFSQ